MAQDQGKAKRLKITNSGTEDLAQCISKYNLELKSDLIAIYRDPDDTTLIKKAIRSLLDFNQSCRRLRGKEKTSLKSDDEEIIEEVSSVKDSDSTKTATEDERRTVLEQFIKFLYECIQKRKGYTSG